MKKISQIYYVFTVLIMTGLLSSCSFFYDELEECPSGQFFTYIYDKTLSGGNAFGPQVGHVALYVFDEEGNYITTIEDDGDALNDNNYRMRTNLEAGTYNFIVWGYQQPVDISFTRSDYSNFDRFFKYIETEDGSINTYLQPLWNANVSQMKIGNEGQQYDFSLTKNTNNIRVVLQQIDGNPVNPDLFDFSIEDENQYIQGSTNYPTGDITYYPYLKGQSTVGGNENGEDQITVAFAEMSTSRLMAGRNTRLKITRNDVESTVINIPLIDYLVMRSSIYASMSDQDYLDRENNYTLILFLDRNYQWITTTIIINGWTVRINDIQ